MYLRIIIFLQLFSLISGPQFSFNEFIRSAVMGQLFNLQCTRSENLFPNFMLFTRNRPNNHQILVPNDALEVSDFNPGRSTKVIIHGFLDSIHMSDWMQRMKTKLLNIEDSNVIIVDWSCGNLFPYARAIDNSKTVSRKLEELIQFLQIESGADPSTFHLIGHSMGCHIAARVGNAIPDLGRITALDPALPRFHRMPVEERLDPSDAKFVDVIHSDAGYSIFEGIGLKTRVGHLDFYPNGGNSQPGCKQPLLSLLSRVGIFNGSAFMGDILSQIPARLQCVGTGKNFTNFMYYSRVHPDKHRPLVPGDKELLYLSDYDPSLPTKVILHGFLDSIHVTDWMQKMKTKLLVTGDHNVVIVDWSCGNEFPYSQAIQNSKITADELTKLIKFLQEETGAKPEDFHLIGHSMGGHIAALVGHAVPHLGRISALDPAGPRFYSAPLEERLDPGDAKFVDAIHTDSGSGLFEGLGMRAQVGHVDFYPNGGKDQPGCHSSPFDILPRIGWQRAARYYTTCDHLRAVEYYTDSIRSPIQPRRSGSVCQPVAVACRDWETYSQGRCADCSHDGDCALMGYNSDLFWNPEINKHEYFVKTSEEEPFCLFQYQVIVETECDHGSCNDASDPSKAAINPGVIRLELKTQAGRMARLDDKEEKEMKPGGQYVYLATSRFPLGGVQAAKIWFGSVRKRTDSLALPRAQSTGLNLKRIEIVPIEIPEKVNNLSSQVQEPSVTVLCGSSSDKSISRNKQLELSINDC